MISNKMRLSIEVATALVVVGAVMYGHAAPVQQPIPNVINTHSLNIIGADGKVVASLASTVDSNNKANGGGLFISDSAGNHRIIVGVSRAGLPGISLLGPDGKRVLDARQDAKGRGSVVIYDKEGEPRIDMGVYDDKNNTKDGVTFITLKTDQSKPQVNLAASDEDARLGVTYSGVGDVIPERNATLWYPTGGYPYFSLAERSNKDVLKLKDSENGPVIEMLQKNGKMLTVPPQP